MALRLFPRGRTACFNICIDGYRIPGSLDYNTVTQHIPHLRDCPRRPATAQSTLGRHTIDADLTAVVRRCRLLGLPYFPISLFQDCLHILVRVLRDFQRHPLHDPGSTLCDGLEQILYNNFDWPKQLRYFTCFAYLFDDSVLKASPALHSGMSSFIVRNCRALAHEAPLSVSLQFVDLCYHTEFSGLMNILFDQLRSQDREELVRTYGLVPLYLGGEPSDAIFTYILQRFGERGSMRERIKIRARHRVRRRRPGLLDRGLFILPR